MVLCRDRAGEVQPPLGPLLFRHRGRPGYALVDRLDMSFGESCQSMITALFLLLRDKVAEICVNQEADPHRSRSLSLEVDSEKW